MPFQPLCIPSVSILMLAEINFWESKWLKSHLQYFDNSDFDLLNRFVSRILFKWGFLRTLRRRIYVPSGWKLYARDRKTLRRTFVSRGKNGCFFDRREKNNFFRGKQMFFSEFFWPRHNVFSLKDTFSSYFILWPPISLYFLMGSVSYCPHKFC